MNTIEQQKQSFYEFICNKTELDGLIVKERTDKVFDDFAEWQSQQPTVIQDAACRIDGKTIKEALEQPTSTDSEIDIKNALEYDPYPEDLFPPVTKGQLEMLNALCMKNFNFPIDRFTAHVGRLLRAGIKSQVEEIVKKYSKTP